MLGKGARMSSWLGKVRQWWDFFRHGIWEVDPSQFNRVQFSLLRQAQVASLVFRDFFADNCLLRASALTYTTLLSIVPLLALMFSLLKGLGVQNTLEPLLLKRIAVGSEQIVTQVLQYINNTSVGRLGTVGLLMLVVTVIALLTNIEKSFNSIWGVTETRTLYRRFSDYFSVVLIGPLLLFAAVSMTTTLASQAFVQKLAQMALVGHLILLLFQVLPYLAMWAAFIFLYIFMPNIKVHFRAALVGGIFGGTLWQLAQWGYVTLPGRGGPLQRHLRHHGGAADPHGLDLCLLGHRPARPRGHLRHPEPAHHPPGDPRRGGQFRQPRAGRPDRAAGVSRRLPARREAPGPRSRSPPSWNCRRGWCAAFSPTWCGSGLLSEVAAGGEEDFAFQPGRAPETMGLHEVVEMLKEDGVSYTRLSQSPERAVIAGAGREDAPGGAPGPGGAEHEGAGGADDRASVGVRRAGQSGAPAAVSRRKRPFS